MLPKPIKHLLRYNSLLLPKEIQEASIELNQKLWNELMLINSKFPDEQIIVQHVLNDSEHNFTINFKIQCTNVDVQHMIDKVYEEFIYLPLYSKPENFEKLKAL
ncbi:MAG: hypothetical protein EOP45_01335 [Sphingobacteriaceae bacterium]|nr:MAG: hypothetical protein EOP45_01335 [Sphingobacteriaceae bacterium]